MNEDSRAPAGQMGPYRIVRTLGRGATAITYEAEDTRSGARVAMKCFSLRGVRDWTAVDRLEREARVLRGLDHPTIPRYLDHFRHEAPDGDSIFVLVQELVEGETLASRVGRGARLGEAEAIEIAGVLLDTLAYLQSQTPPFVHRDIKPEHVIGRNGGVWLVDFGSVQSTYTNTIGGATVTGTIGYMAPEQLRGRAGPATDLFGLAATLAFAITGRDPASLPMHRGRIEVGRAVSPRLRRWFARMLAPIPEDRFRDAQAALRALRPGRFPLAKALLAGGVALGVVASAALGWRHAPALVAAAPSGPVARAAPLPAIDDALASRRVLGRALGQPYRPHVPMSETEPEGPIVHECIVSWGIGGTAVDRYIAHDVGPKACVRGAEEGVYRFCKASGRGGNHQIRGQLNLIDGDQTTSRDFNANCADSPYGRMVCLPDPCPRGQIKDASCVCVDLPR